MVQRKVEHQDKPSSFQLDKWYLDCVSETGRAVVGYSAELKWNSFALSYASYLTSGVPDVKHSKTSLLHRSSPEISHEGSITWDVERLSCNGFWRPHLSGSLPPLRLFDDAAGFIDWHCHQPLSEAHVRIKDAELSGLGYAEQLVMTVPPWKLPVHELFWGHFLSQAAYLVWIEWRGPLPMNLAFLNGEKIGNVEISEAAVAWDNGRLELTEQVVLRKGSLVHTALSRIPGVKALFPRSVLYTQECKWRSHGKLMYQGGTHTGWVIHEIVQFGGEK